MLRENDKSRGKTHYWITSAKEIGLIDCNSRAGGIRFATPRSSSAASGSIVTAHSGLADNDSVSEGAHNQVHESEGYHHNMAQSYQPHNNLDFPEGPSQKHREAASGDVSSSAFGIESPMKKEATETHASQASTTLSEGRGNTMIVAAKSEPVCLPSSENPAPVAGNTTFSAVTV